MRCPSCKEPLIVDGEARMQSLSEHVSDPNGIPSLKKKYICSIESCPTHDYGVHWSSIGDRYSDSFMPFAIADRIFINKNDAPFGSFQRQANVEIYRVGVKEKLWIPAWIMLNYLQPYIDFNYTADEDGHVLKRRWRLKFIYNKGKRKGVVMSMATRTWAYLWKMFKRDLHRYETTKKERYLLELFKPSYNRAWTYRWFEAFIKIWYIGLYKRAKAVENIKKFETHTLNKQR